MKRKNLIILLLIPFLIALLIVQIGNRNLGPKSPRDIVSIEWEYDDNEPFKLTNLTEGNKYKLEAEGYVPKGYYIDEGNDLIWSVTNQDLEDTTEYAKIEKDDNGVYWLVVLKEGFVTVTCTNEKGNVSKQMTACIYTNGLIMINTAISSSQNNIDSTIYYGNKDILNYQLVDATIDFNITTIPTTLIDELEVSSVSSNIEFDLKGQKVKVKNGAYGKASFTLQPKYTTTIQPSTYSFEIVKDGVNVYTYQDLLYCTNKSEEGQIVVLRKSFESVQNAYKYNQSGELQIENGKPMLKANNVECFGTYDHTKALKDAFNFDREVYRFATTYNDNYINQWNDFASKSNGKYQPITNQVVVGLHVQKDFYGNGYTINMHNLTFAYDYISGSDAPDFTTNKLFTGPLPFYVLGDPNNLYLVKAYGQDNIGMYVEGNEITVNDVDMKNCDFGNYLSNLETVGTVIDIYGNDVTIKNSRFSSGKNVMRAFSSQSLAVLNCSLSYSRNFLFTTGSNEYIPVDGSQNRLFYDKNGQQVMQSLNQFLSSENETGGDVLLNEFITTDTNPADVDKIRSLILSIQDAMNTQNLVENRYMGSTEIKDCMFYQSGIAPIAAETYFNGPFLYNASPSIITDTFQTLLPQLLPFVPTNVSGIGYPVKINISGDTRFYDYKVVKDIDLSGLVGENITRIANDFGIYDGTLSIDNIFPLKTYLVQAANDNKYNYYDANTGKAMANIAFAFYGGGINLSQITYDNLDTKENMMESTKVNFLEENLKFSSGGSATEGMMKNLLVKTVPVVTGYEPFRFNYYLGKGYLFGKAPSKADLIANAKKYK